MRHLCSQEEDETAAANLVNKLTGGTRHLQLLSLPAIFLPPLTHLSLSVFGYSEIVMQGLEIKNSPTEL